MLNEQIKKEVSDQVEKKLTDKLDLFNLPLKSQYKMLLFSGRADGTDLVPGFDFQIINNKKVVIKSIKIVPYYFGIGVDISLDDGAGTVINENTYANQRINRLFDDFVSDATFDGYVKQADFLLPLIHPNTRSAEQYIAKQISGMFNLSYSYKIPMLMHNAYQSTSDLEKSAFFYEPESFEIDLKPALEKRFEKVKQITDEPTWKVEFQMRRFLEFIGV
jgi:hypothetical protein